MATPEAGQWTKLPNIMREMAGLRGKLLKLFEAVLHLI